MTQEEKLQEAKRLYKTANSDQRYVLESLFPELKESEDEKIRKDVYNYLYNERHNIRQLTPYTDELDRWLAWLEKQKPINISIEDKRIRKSLINYVKAHGNGGDFTKEKYIAWLEKQNEQKPADKIEPRFKNGQWIVWQNKCYKVNYNGCGYELIDQNGLSTSLEYGTIDESAHVFTIQDAKDGDVLVSFCNQPFIYNGKFTEISVGGYCGLDVYGNFIEKSIKECNWTNNEDIKPATKEQRDQLENAMADAGYTFDFENKELKKIHIIDEGKSEMDYCFTKMMNGEKVSPIWSEEDEDILRTIISDGIRGAELDMQQIDWLKSLRERIGG